MTGADFESEVLRRLARIEAQQDVRCSARGERLDDMQEQIDDHERRLRPLETQHTRVVTVAAGAGLFGSVLIKLGAWMWGAR